MGPLINSRKLNEILSKLEKTNQIDKIKNYDDILKILVDKSWICLCNSTTFQILKNKNIISEGTPWDKITHTHYLEPITEGQLIKKKSKSIQPRFHKFQHIIFEKNDEIKGLKDFQILSIRLDKLKDGLIDFPEDMQFRIKRLGINKDVLTEIDGSEFASTVYIE
jgi:hypothetical protein